MSDDSKGRMVLRSLRFSESLLSELWFGIEQLGGTGMTCSRTVGS